MMSPGLVRHGAATYDIRMGETRRRTVASIAAALLIGLTLGGGIAPAHAVTTPSWAEWDPLTGVGGAYSTGFTLPGTPAIAAQAKTDSRAGQVGVISGASTWLAPSTPVGLKYGSSKNLPYLNLRPKADNSASPSTTTYTFAQPTPTSNWAFVLGDIDADQLQIRAVGPDGVALTAAQLGFRGGFNYCAPRLAGKPSCTGDAADVPQWDPATLTLLGNDAAADTNGAAAWFEPVAPISALTFSFTRRSGFPVYQTWFTALTRDIAGTVTAQSGDGSGATLTLTDPSGAVVATALTVAGGGYSFPGVQASAGYTVSVQAPSGQIVDGPARKPANLSEADATVDFNVRDIVPVAVSGIVTESDGTPVPGATVTIPGVGSVTTAADGSYLFDTVPVGTYQPELTVPPGFNLQTVAPPFTVPPGSEVPITGEDFVISALPSLSGQVTEAGSAASGVTVTASGPGGHFSTVTATDGSYSFPGLIDGEYVITVTAPDGTVPDGPLTRTTVVAGSSVTGIDFALQRTGSLAGTVVAGGAPRAGVGILIDGPNGQAALTTDAAGEYDLGGLLPGSYTITVTAPEGYRVSGAGTRTVTITAAGEAVVDQDFMLIVEDVVPPTTVPPTGPPTVPAVPTEAVAHGKGLASTGAGSALVPMLGIAAGALILLGAGALVVRAVRKR